MTAVYVHIPFCRQICHYCDFNKVFLEGQPVDEYVSMLLREVALTMQKQERLPIRTVYIGGGTPTCLSAQQLDRLLSGLHRELDVTQVIEWTVEANPGDMTPDKMQVLRDYGVNRLSMGVQSFDDQLLARIGRSHRVKQVYQSIDAARCAGFDNISIDLIFRLPNQTLAQFEHSLRAALALDLPHYAVYSLILENKTIFYQLMRRGKLPLPSEDEDADMYQLALSYFAERGIEQYEISNFAKKGYCSQHNVTYWRNKPYYGFGAGAHGYIGGRRYKNFGPIQHYLQPLRAYQLPMYAAHQLSPQEVIEEAVFLGLRMCEGIDLAAFEQQYQHSVLDVYEETVATLQAKGLLEVCDNRLKLSERSIFLGDYVFRSFIGAPQRL